MPNINLFLPESVFEILADYCQEVDIDFNEVAQHSMRIMALSIKYKDQKDEGLHWHEEGHEPQKVYLKEPKNDNFDPLDPKTWEPRK